MLSLGSLVEKLLGNHSERIYAFMRMIAGVLFAFHGAQKVLGVWSRSQPELFSQIWIGGVIELVCGLLIAIGLFTRTAAFLSSGTMAVAYIQFHWKFQFGKKFLPGLNHGELAVVYCFLFLYIASRGGGQWSADRVQRP